MQAKHHQPAADNAIDQQKGESHQLDAPCAFVDLRRKKSQAKSPEAAQRRRSSDPFRGPVLESVLRRGDHASHLPSISSRGAGRGDGRNVSPVAWRIRRLRQAERFELAADLIDPHAFFGQGFRANDLG